ncbi:uncharacterized protein [Nicotiana sylvestris]|uniref:uncharacterized protein n=1 Tax=Nicotiana sylvestris TaxID=4096 RepID=UPI00388C8A95
MGDSIVVDRVHHSCIVVIEGLGTRVDMLLLDMVDFDVILGMDWLSPYHVILDCHAKTVTLALPAGRSTVQHGGAKQVTLDDDGVLRLQGRVHMALNANDPLGNVVVGEEVEDLEQEDVLPQAPRRG